MPMDRNALLEKTELSEDLLGDSARCQSTDAFDDLDAGVTHGDINTGCDRPATWVGRLVCGHPMLFCDIHREALLVPPASSIETGMQCQCGQLSPAPRITWARV